MSENSSGLYECLYRPNTDFVLINNLKLQSQYYLKCWTGKMWVLTYFHSTNAFMKWRQVSDLKDVIEKQGRQQRKGRKVDARKGNTIIYYAHLLRLMYSVAGGWAKSVMEKWTHSISIKIVDHIVVSQLAPSVSLNTYLSCRVTWCQTAVCKGEQSEPSI